jgi:mRNA interferase MazF
LLRYPVVIVVPLTTQSGPWTKKNPNLYRHLPAGAGGIPQDSIALLDQVRALDVRRVNAYLGSLEPEIFTPIRNTLLRLFDEVQE